MAYLPAAPATDTSTNACSPPGPGSIKSCTPLFAQRCHARAARPWSMHEFGAQPSPFSTQVLSTTKARVSSGLEARLSQLPFFHTSFVYITGWCFIWFETPVGLLCSHQGLGLSVGSCEVVKQLSWGLVT